MLQNHLIANKSCFRLRLCSSATATARAGCRALLDCGSQANFIAKKFVKALDLETRPLNVSISGVNGTVTSSNHVVKIKLQSRLNSYTAIECRLLISNDACKIPVISLARDKFNFPRNIRLADPRFHISSDIDLLIGTDTVDELKLIRDETIQLLKLGAFELSKWASNCSELLEIDNRDCVPIIIRDNATHVFWACNGISARIRFSANLIQELTLYQNTFRCIKILSEVAKLFDPLGLLGPVIVFAKLILQDLRQLVVQWDEFLRTSTLVGLPSEHR